jgi:integrase
MSSGCVDSSALGTSEFLHSTRLGRRLIDECGWRVVKDITPKSFRDWRKKQTKAPKTLNEYLHTVSALLNWMVADNRLAANPLESIEPVDTRGQQRRRRRALTDDEVTRLLAVAGRWRAVYLTAVLTGLRRNELASLIWAHVHLDAPRPFIAIPAHVDKARCEQTIWLHPEVADALRALRPAPLQPTDCVFPQMPRMDIHQTILSATHIPYKDELGAKRISTPCAIHSTQTWPVTACPSEPAWN